MNDPSIYIRWTDGKRKNDLSDIFGDENNPCICKQMVEDPEFDLSVQLESVRISTEFLTAGKGFCNIPFIHLLHFRTGPLATAFGSKAILREDHVLAFEPVVHTPGEVLKLQKPDLQKDGMCKDILERIDYYNEATQGKILILPCDTAGSWSIATQIWHFEDMLEAIYTAPEVVNGFLDMVTECIIEFIHIQMERIGRNFCSFNHTGMLWNPRGWYLGDDTMVTVSPKQFREFFMPYNERIAREFGGIIYHCCMNHDFQFENMADTKGFMGFDANPDYNSHDLIEKALSGKGVWARSIDDWGLIDRFRGKVGLFLLVRGSSRQEALDNASRLREHLQLKQP